MDGRRMRWQVGIADCQPLRILKRREWVMMQAPQIITQKHVQILRAMHFYRFMTALDVATYVYTKSQLGKVRNVLADLCGGADFQERQYLYRFPLAGRGNSERVYTLGSRGRDYLSEVVGLPCPWYFRPDKVKHFSHAHIVHSLLLTRTLVAAEVWAREKEDLSLAVCRISYELSEEPPVVVIKNREGRQERVKVVPDAWLRFDRSDGKKLPVLWEIDRGREHQIRFKEHIASRLALLVSGEYERVFGQRSARIAYLTTGERPEYGPVRVAAMCRWCLEVLSEQGRGNWAGLFRFAPLTLEGVYDTPLFDGSLWHVPGETGLVSLTG
jgi:hypothetical protein